jgi:hypothetical protein
MTSSAMSTRPQTLREVGQRSESIEDFGLNLRDWQHDIQRTHVHSRRELASRLAEKPSLLRGRFEHGDVADAYLAAYADWIASEARIPQPSWCRDRRRRADTHWFSTPDHESLLSRTPAPFRRRGLFTIPDQVFTPRRGRPRVSTEDKHQKAILRQRAYRTRIRELVKEARAHRAI